MTSVAALRFALVSTLAATVAAVADTCPVTASTPQSCKNTTAVTNTCCFNSPGGQLLQTQFWDTDPETGPTNSWTIHGLWPDECNGGYQESCDESRAYTNVTQVIEQYDPTGTLLAYIQKYWKNDDGTDEELWEHEWETHGTCISTFDTKCYTNYKPAEELYDFVNSTVSLFKTLNSYELLTSAGISPSSSKTYTSKQITAALAAGHGGIAPTILCSDDELDQIYYGFETKGSVQTGEFIPVAATGESSSCPSSGIKWVPKTTSSRKSNKRAARAVKH